MHRIKRRLGLETDDVRNVLLGGRGRFLRGPMLASPARAGLGQMNFRMPVEVTPGQPLNAAWMTGNDVKLPVQ